MAAVLPRTCRPATATSRSSEAPGGVWAKRFAAAVLGLSLMGAGPTAPDPARLAPIHGAVAALLAAQSRNDKKAIDALSGGQMAAIDEVAPFTWSGPAGNADWAKAFARGLAAEHITDPDPRLVDLVDTRTVGDLAFVTYTVDYRFKRAGKREQKTGVETFVLARDAGRWAHVGYAWAGEGRIDPDAIEATRTAAACTACRYSACRARVSAGAALIIDAVGGVFGGGAQISSRAATHGRACRVTPATRQAWISGEDAFVSLWLSNGVENWL